MKIEAAPGVVIESEELSESFLQAGGPGGQNVNKLATAVQLRFDAARSPNLSEHIRERLRTVAGRRMTLDGVIVITARTYRTRERNRAEALERLLDLLRRAAERRKPRRATRPGRGVVERRKESKIRASTRKAERRREAPE